MGTNIDPFNFPDPEIDTAEMPGQRSIVLGGGCFWCTEAVYTQLRGVVAVKPGYAGDSQSTADYKTVCGGGTNHAEVIEVVYDTSQIKLGQILKIFFSIAHDPTQKDRQGGDIGRQYRSVIFYSDAEQKSVAEAYIAQLTRGVGRALVSRAGAPSGSGRYVTSRTSRPLPACPSPLLPRRHDRPPARDR
jgi:peptide-methionine (S)-S-oxide reductase